MFMPLGGNEAVSSQQINDENVFVAESLLTVQEVAQICKVPVSWVYERTRRRGLERLPHVKLGKYLRFDPAEVRSWLLKFREK